jgi:hypothetical protein
MRDLIILIIHLITTVLRPVRPGRLSTVVAEYVADRDQALDIKKDPASCLAGKVGWWRKSSAVVYRRLISYTVLEEDQEIVATQIFGNATG